MLAPNRPLPPLETLANGLRVSLRHVPRLKHCAAVLRVAAGSHDVPPSWPGLAHFLEHLLFLGTERFPAEQGLMAFVRAQGGQLNAKTSERSTEFFFELPVSAFAGGLERLCDMLARPRMDLVEQRREREVLHAEFIAWSRDATAQRQFALCEGLNAAHPLRAFHAGNRYSLNLPSQAFQHGLQQFHRDFYQAGQMTLSLVGPQPVEELRALAERYGACLPAGQPLEQRRPPALLTTPTNAYQQLDGQRLDLLFTAEGLPEGASVALDFLCTWLQSDKPGGLLASLRQQSLAHSLKAQVLYTFAGQALLHLELGLAQATTDAPIQIRTRLMDWLAFFAAQGDWPQLREEYALLQQRRLQVGGALELARRDSCQTAQALNETGLEALKTLLRQLQPQTVDTVSGDWQLPPPNPFLHSVAEAPQPGLIRGQSSRHRGLRTFAQDRSRGRRDHAGLTFSQALPAQTGEGVLLLRWRLAAPAPSGLHHRLQQHLTALAGDARQAGVELSLTACGRDWILQLRGLHQPMPAVLQQALQQLAEPSSAFWQPSAGLDEAPPMPLRQLLKVFAEQPVPGSDEALTPQALQALWSNARWNGLAVALPSHLQDAVARVLQRTPGTADTEPGPVPQPEVGHTWQTVPMDSTEQALLLFCPAPPGNLAAEAAWRLLGQLCQTPFYQRLRVELQLGYGVFSAVRQLDGRTGLLFGVQSPNTSLEQILGHLEHFLEHLPEQLQALDAQAWQDQRQALAQQLQPTQLPLDQAAQLLWQAQQAGHPADYLQQLPACIETLTPAAVIDAAHQLQQATNGWKVLANGPCPGSPWQVAR